jgi:hypothetical protein
MHIVHTKKELVRFGMISRIQYIDKIVTGNKEVNGNFHLIAFVHDSVLHIFIHISKQRKM